MELRSNRSLAQFFQNVPTFAELDSDELSELLRIGQPFTRQAGEVLFKEGDPADGMYVVERGEVSVSKAGAGGENVTLAYLGNGAVIGEMGLFDGGGRSASVEAVAMTTGHWFSRRKFLQLREGRSAAAYKVLLAVCRTLEERRRTTEGRIRMILEEPDRESALQTQAVRDMIGRMTKA